MDCLGGDYENVMWGLHFSEGQGNVCLCVLWQAGTGFHGRRFGSWSGSPQFRPAFASSPNLQVGKQPRVLLCDNEIKVFVLVYWPVCFAC